jgi:hypothetical protein
VARRRLPPPIRGEVVRVIEMDDSEPIARVKVEWPEEPPRPLTQRQQMIVAITRRRWRGRITVSIAEVLRHVRTVWEDECRRRKLPEPWPPVPNRDTVARALRAASLID